MKPNDGHTKLKDAIEVCRLWLHDHEHPSLLKHSALLTVTEAAEAWEAFMRPITYHHDEGDYLPEDDT